MHPMMEWTICYCLVWGLIYGAVIFPKYEAQGWMIVKEIRIPDLVNYITLIASCVIPLLILNVMAHEMRRPSLDQEILLVALGSIGGYLIRSRVAKARSV